MASSFSIWRKSKRSISSIKIISILKTSKSEGGKESGQKLRSSFLRQLADKDK
jgi:hypothetical protein